MKSFTMILIACVLAGCQGTSPTDPSVRACVQYARTTGDTLQNGQSYTVHVDVKDSRCRAAG